MVEITRAGRFDWGDAGIGAGFAGGIVLLLGALLLVGSHRRRGLKSA